MKLPTLYTTTSRSQIQEWTIEFDGARFRTHEGIHGGTITISRWTECMGKNIGRSNETTPEQQAEREARAKHQKKLDKGYTPDISKAAISTFFEPMLAHSWKDYADEAEWPVGCQPKLDGARCVVKSDGMWTRNGKPIVAAPHIFEALQSFFAANPNAVLDGELYADHLAHDFNRLMSLAKQIKPTADDLAASRAELEYWIYDCDLGGKETFQERSAWLRKNVKEKGGLRLVETKIARTPTELDVLYEGYLEAGYEGQMVRALGSVYEHKRSRNLLKRKEMQDAEFELVDLQEGRGNRSGMATRAVLRLQDGRTFEAGVIGSHEYCIELLKRKSEVCGKPGTTQFQNFTPDGIPRFGKLKAIRDFA